MTTSPSIVFSTARNCINQVLNYDVRHSYEFAITVDKNETT